MNRQSFIKFYHVFPISSSLVFLFHGPFLGLRGLWEQCVNLISTMRRYGMAPNETLDFCRIAMDRHLANMIRTWSDLENLELIWADQIISDSKQSLAAKDFPCLPQLCRVNAPRAGCWVDNGKVLLPLDGPHSIFWRSAEVLWAGIPLPKSNERSQMHQISSDSPHLGRFARLHWSWFGWQMDLFGKFEPQRTTFDDFTDLKCLVGYHFMWYSLKNMFKLFKSISMAGHVKKAEVGLKPWAFWLIEPSLSPFFALAAPWAPVTVPSLDLGHSMKFLWFLDSYESKRWGK